MALLTDGNPADIATLQTYETAILTVANTEMIDLNAKLTLAAQEISLEILNILLDHAMGTDQQTILRRNLGVSDVVVSPQIVRWHSTHTLEIVYRDAFNNQLNDRYQAKWNEYGVLAKNARAQLLRYGIGLSLNPVPEPAAPQFSSVAGPFPDTIYYVQTTWLSALGQESAPSPVTTYETPAGTALVIQTTNPPAVAASWNAYIGLSVSTVTLQNPTPIPVGQSFTLPSSGLVNGPAPGNGQSADVYMTGGSALSRG